MEQEFPIVVVTQAQFGNVKRDMGPGVFRARIQAAQELITAVVAQGHAMVVQIDTETGSNFENLGATLLRNPDGESSKEFGKERRLLFLWAKDYLESHGGKGAVIWTEPEKTDLARFIKNIIEPIKNGKADMVLPRRRSLVSYPFWQRSWEDTGNRMCQIVSGKDYDFFFGPKVLSTTALNYYIEYPRGEAVSDSWDSISSPILDAIALDAKIAEVEIDFQYPQAQLESETEDLDILLKRTKGLDVIITEFVKRRRYWENLGIEFKKPR